MNKRSRRTPEQQIADLQAKITELQERKERREALQDPARRHVAAALRTVDKALEVCSDAALKTNLRDVRERLAGCVDPKGVLVPKAAPKSRPRPAASQVEVDPDAVLRYLKLNPGSRCEDVAKGLDLESSAISPVLKALKTDGKARTEGQARGTKYFAGAAR